MFEIMGKNVWNLKIFWQNILYACNSWNMSCQLYFFASYKQVMWCVYKGIENRRVIPSCDLWSIQNLFPEPDDKYLLYIKGKKDKIIVRSSHPKVICKKDVCINIAEFTGKHLCQSLIKRRLWHSFFLWTGVYRTPPAAASALYASCKMYI